MQHKIILVISALALLASSFIASASGYSSGGYNSRDTQSVPRRAVDQNYEVGKAIFNGRQKGEPSLQYCIVMDGEKVPVKRKSVKAYKGETYQAFADNLFQCDQPEKLVAEGLTRDSLLYVVYYLNKRHKLQLRGS